MKHLRLNTLFHWLYAFLMLMPIIIWGAQYVLNFATGNAVTETLQDYFYQSWVAGAVAGNINGVYYYLMNNLLGLINTPNVIVIVEALTYWTIVSMVYLVFDVLMIPVNLFHRWIDEGSF